MTTRRRLTAVPETARRAVLYVRVSALMGRSGDAFHSPDLQLDAMRAMTGRNALVEVEVVQDIDRSGRTFAREGFDRVMDLARTGKVDVVAVYDLSRFGRNAGESLRHIAELRDLGVSVVSTVERIDDSPEGQFMLGQFLGMAQLYSDQIGRRWQNVIEHRARQGRWHGSNPPFGYALTPGSGLTIDPVTGPWMREAFERYAAGHLSSHVARDLGLRRGKTFALSQLKRSLYNPIYVGRVVVNEVEYPAQHEPLIDEHLWERVRQRLDRDTRTPSRRLAVSHSLVGLVVCDQCSKHLQLHADLRRPEPLVGRLQCRTRLLGGPEQCLGPGTPSQHHVEAAVLAQIPEMIRGLKVDPGARAAKQASRARATVEADHLERELAKANGTLAALTVDRAAREITLAAYQSAAESLEQSIAALAAQLDAARLVVASPPPRATVRQAEALLEVWGDSTIAEQNRGLRLLLREVRVRRAAFRNEPMLKRVTPLLFE